MESITKFGLINPEWVYSELGACYHYKKAALMVTQCYCSLLQHRKEKKQNKTKIHTFYYLEFKILMKSNKFKHVYCAQSKKWKQ